MRIFIKYVLKSMTEKKGRFFLLIAAISISTALLPASMGLIDIILDSLANPMIEANENRDIIIHSTDESSVFYSDNGLNTSGIDKNSVLKELYIDGQIIENKNTEEEVMHKVTVRGRNMQDVNDDIIIEGNLKDFEGESCIISDRTAKEKNLVIGDSLDIIVGGKTKNLNIRAISGPSGVFYNDTNISFTILIPYEYLSKDFKEEGKYNLILANTSEETVKEGVEKFNNDNTLFTAEQLSDKDTVKEQMSGFTSILYVMLIVVAAMSAIIIYSSFKLIIAERLSTIGTFLSQGSTIGKVKFILYIESLFYGMLGALLGNILAIFGLNIINRFISPLKEYGIFGKVDIEPIYLIAGTLFAVILSTASAYFPIRKISKLQIKEIILNDVRISKSIGWRKFIIGATILGISIVIFMTSQSKLGVYSVLLMIVSLAGVILAYPKLIDILSKWLFRFLRGKSRNVLYAINKLRTSKILLGNISLIIISLTSIIIMTSMGKSMIDIVTKSYTDMGFDIVISNISTIREHSKETTADYLVKELKKYGVDEQQINLMSDQFGEIISPNTNNNMSIYITGINPDTYIKFNNYLNLDDVEYNQYIENFKKDASGVIITTVLSKKFNKTIGDTIQISCNGQKKTLNISGIIDGKLYNSGQFALIKNDTLKEQYGILSANSITFETNKKNETILNEIKPILRETGTFAETRDERCKTNIRANQKIVNALSIFSYMAIIIAALGIVNNISISFLQRKSEFAILASVGMENSGRAKIMFFESIASVTWAMVITSLYSLLSCKLVSIMTKAIGLEISITLDYKSLPMIYLISLIIVLTATIPVYFKSRKLSIIQELKYE